MRSGLLFLALLTACAPRTGLELEVRGPLGTTSVEAGVVELELVAGHASYCERWVTDSAATGRRFEVKKRDLTRSPLRILLEPVQETDLAAQVLPIVLARDATGRTIGVASFGEQRFRFEKVERYVATIALFGEGREATGPSYAATDGCTCIPGQASIGNGTQKGCDLALPPSFARLADTAGCELASGAALPSGVCDGQLYPNEVPGRALPCFRASGGVCSIGQRICDDQNGRAYTSECKSDASLALPTGVLCDAFLACQQTACVDPVECLKTSTPARHPLRCTLRVMLDGGMARACDGAQTSVVVAATTGTACVASMLDGTRVGIATLGWKAAGQSAAQVTSDLCPPTLQLDALDAKDAMSLAPTSFTATIGDTLYDVELSYPVGCDTKGKASNDLRCVGL